MRRGAAFSHRRPSCVEVPKGLLLGGTQEVVAFVRSSDGHKNAQNAHTIKNLPTTTIKKTGTKSNDADHKERSSSSSLKQNCPLTCAVAQLFLTDVPRVSRCPKGVVIRRHPGGWSPLSDRLTGMTGGQTFLSQVYLA
ncbi:hypothetical protein CDAR_127441 [Caerostris darwini]|uniref:Uncharacterized protein n=1 Tax=Caerostris darwini TaxID=1538125 RepID=A0AAV4UUY2_9ARAC|nr:hypothetical protein CDAR_127441 [Caerostris darwini]